MPYIHQACAGSRAQVADLLLLFSSKPEILTIQNNINASALLKDQGSDLPHVSVGVRGLGSGHYEHLAVVPVFGGVLV